MDKKDWLILGGIAGVGFLYWKLVSGKNNNILKSTSSSFNGSPFGQRVMFTLRNKTAQTQVVPLFNSYSNIQNPNVEISPSISEFNRGLLNEPKKVTMIEIRGSGNQKQAEMPIKIQCKDASGEYKGTFLYPMISPFQKALDMTSIQPNNLVISGKCYLDYTLDPSQTVVLIFHYELQTPMQGAEIVDNQLNQPVLVEKTEGQNNQVAVTNTQQTTSGKKSNLTPYLIGGGAVAVAYYLFKK